MGPHTGCMADPELRHGYVQLQIELTLEVSGIESALTANSELRTSIMAYTKTLLHVY